MNSLIPFVKQPTFYSPKNLGNNALATNLAPSTGATNIKRPVFGSNVTPVNALTALDPYTPDYGGADTAETGAPTGPDQGVATVSAETSLADIDMGIDMANLGAATLPGPLGLMANKTAHDLEGIQEQQAKSMNLSLAEFQDMMDGQGESAADGDDAVHEDPAEHAPAAHENDDGTGGTDGGTTVICTELRRQGLMSNHIWAADLRYGQQIDPQIREGYLVWGLPTVKLMQKSKLFTKAVNLLAKPWSEHMAYKMGAIKADNRFGALLMSLGVPLCRLLASSGGKQPNPQKVR